MQQPQYNYGQPPSMMPSQNSQQSMPPHRDHEAQPLLYQNQPSQAPPSHSYNNAYAPPPSADANRVSGTYTIQRLMDNSLFTSPYLLCRDVHFACIFLRFCVA